MTINSSIPLKSVSLPVILELCQQGVENRDPATGRRISLTTARCQNSGYAEVWNPYLRRNVRVEPCLATLAASLLRRYPLQHCYTTTAKWQVSLTFGDERSAGNFVAVYFRTLNVFPLSGGLSEAISGKVVDPELNCVVSRNLYFVDIPEGNVDAVIQMLDGCQTAA